MLTYGTSVRSSAPSAASKMHEAGKRVAEMLTQFRELEPDNIGERLQFAIVDSDEAGEIFTFTCSSEGWMTNPHNTLHGGVAATVLDHAMGTVVTAIVPEGSLVATSEMQISYHRPLFAARTLDVVIRVLSRSRSLVHLTGEIRMADAPERLCVSGTSVYFYRENRG